VALETECGGVNEIARDECFGDGYSVVKGLLDVARAQRADVAGYRHVTEIRVGCNFTRRDTQDRRMGGKIHSVGDDGGG
jgi:hypothetical protein